MILLTTFGTLAQKASHSLLSSSVLGHNEPEHAQRWHSSEVTISLDPSLRSIHPDTFGAIQQALAGWEKLGAEIPRVRFDYGEPTKVDMRPDGHNTIIVAPIDIPGHETDLAVTIGFSNPRTGELSEADIVINSRHVFSQIDPAEHESPESCLSTTETTHCKGSYDLQNVLAHEFGHFFGLGENPSDPKATMFSCTSACETHKRDLEPADRQALVALYASAPVAGLGCGAAQFSQGRGALGSESALTGLLLLGGVIWLRRRSEQATLD